MLRIIKIHLFMLGFVLTSCVDVAQLGQSSGSQTRKTSSGSSGTPTETKTPEEPDLGTSLNLFQKVNKQISGFVDIEHDYNDLIFLRGKQVNEYLKTTQTSQVHCLLTVYPTSTGDEIVITALSPQSAINYGSGELELFFQFNPNSDQAATHCNTASVTNYMTTVYPTYTSTNLIQNACPNCSFFQLNSSDIILMTPTGTVIGPQQIDISYLGITILTQTSSQVDDTFFSCTSNSTCTSKNFDCCAGGQCIMHGSKKSGIDESSDEYKQAQADIEEDHNNIRNYPQFYNLCPQVVVPDPTPEPPEDPEEGVKEQVLSKRELYECTTPIDGEMSLCTITYLNASQSGPTFYTSEDDRNFNNTYYGTVGLPSHSIDQVIYAGETLYKDGAIIEGMTIGPSGNGTGNDNLTDTQQIDISHTPGNTAPDDTLKIRYKVDGSCEKLSSRLAKCYKEYIQGQNKGEVDDHFPVSNQFHMPFYADTNRNVIVEVDGTKKESVLHYTLQATASPPYVEFPGGTTTMSVLNDQKVKLTYYVDLTTYPNLMVQKEAALEKIKSICDCSDTKCRFEPKLDKTGEIIDYICDYPDTNDNAPLFKVVALDTRTIPHRYFDTNGLHQTDLGNAEEQEGNKFEYTNNNVLKPNNVDQYVGFNEIYGSLNTYTDTRPAMEIDVVKRKSYDIFVDNGVFATCLQCGNDYYNNLMKLFPDSFPFDFGGGLKPRDVTDVFGSSSNREYRKDDILFGRACWVPATMIPWTHRAQSDVQAQRLDRLAAQHFMFANGYQRDWYGFDYGSVIGSFDGVLWFSIGNKRRITATSNKLYLAVNAYFADLTVDNSFQVTIQDSVTTIDDNPIPTTNLETTGAECQQYHICETDSDCAASLGWDYSCESVSSMTSPWPSFDSQATELPNDEPLENLANLFTLGGGGTSKRCVYRGKGALCIGGYETSDGNNTFSGTTKNGLHACSSNNYCQKFEDGTLVDKFNIRISRYGKSVANQNILDDGTLGELDYVGLHARSIGRSYEWIGTDEIPSNVRSNLTRNKAFSMCIPGRDPSDTTLLDNHTVVPSSNDDGDKINGIGVTPSGTASDDYYSSCSVFGTDGNYIYKSEASGTLLSDSAIANVAASQALSTNALSIFESSNMTDNEIIKNFNAEHIDELFLQENRCLRAPGSTCFSNMDCAANSFIADQISVIDSENSTIQTILNKYEVKFWQEELICSQEKSPGDEDFSVQDNKCCRETNNSITIATATFDPSGGGSRDVDTTNIPGLSTAGISLSDPLRYSRMSTIWDLRSGGSAANFPPLETQAADTCTDASDATCGLDTDLDRQFNTFSAFGERTCCSGNWVREFSDSNGGGHKWGPEKMQTIPVETFRCYNWSQCSPGVTCGSNFFTCDHTETSFDPSCRIKTTFPGSSQANAIFDWIATMELTGIPQIRIKTKDNSAISCNVDPGDQSSSGAGIIPRGLLQDPDGAVAGDDAEYADVGDNERFYSAADENNLNTDNLKTVFSPDKITCCLPPGTEVETNDDPNICCTGFIAAGPGGKGICQLPDFSNVSVFLNKYVSSTAKDEPLTSFDTETGYLDSGTTTKLICEKNICASGSFATGITISSLRVPGHDTKADESIIRFLDGTDNSNNFSGLVDLYDEGLRWNTHFYCVPAEYENAIPCN
jgi:hypothetical protein